MPPIDYVPKPKPKPRTVRTHKPRPLTPAERVAAKSRGMLPPAGWKPPASRPKPKPRPAPVAAPRTTSTTRTTSSAPSRPSAPRPSAPSRPSSRRTTTTTTTRSSTPRTTKPAAAKPAATSIEDRIKKDPGLVRRWLKNPGLRSKLPERYLPAGQRKARQLNVRLNQPIVEGSSTTERELANEAQAAMTTKYAPLEAQQKTALGEEQNRARDTGSFYDQYQKQLAAHAQNVQNIGNQAAQTGLNTQNAVTGLAAADLTGIQGQANTDAAQRGATAGDVSQMASNAAAVRQSLVGSFVAQQAAQNAANQNYSGTLANVVAPGQKLGAQAMAQGKVAKARENIATTARERGAADLQYRSEARSAEGKNVLARQIANVEATNKATDNALQAAQQKETARANRARETAAEKRAREKRESDDADRRARAAGTTGTGSDTVYTSGAFSGRKKSEVSAMSPAERKKIVDAYNKTGGTSKPAAGPKWVTPNESGGAMTQLTGLKSAASKAKTGLKFEPTGKEKGPDPNARLTREQARAKILGYAPISSKLKHPVLVDASLDAVYSPGYLTASTVKALKAAGYKPSEVARTLGVRTAGQVPTYNDRIRSGEVAGPIAPGRR